MSMPNMKNPATSIFFRCFSVKFLPCSTIREQHRRELRHLPNRHNNVNLMKQLKRPKPGITPPPYTRLGQVLIGLVLILSVAGCHFPQPMPEDQAASAQRQTEIAGIFNPDIPHTPTPQPLPTQGVSGVTPPANPVQQVDGYLFYTVQQGETLPALALRFGVDEHEILTHLPLFFTGLLPIGVQIQVPDQLENTLPHPNPILPDSEVIYGPSTANFDAFDYIKAAGGFLAGYEELVRGEMMTGPSIV